MRKTILIILITSFFYACNESSKEKVLVFKPLETTQFNFSADSTFVPPNGEAWEARRKSHDSCMGEAFAANAIFLKTTDTFRLGCIMNMQTLKVVKNLNLFSLPPNMFGIVANFMTKPCYEKMHINASPSTFMNHKITLAVDSVDARINEELTNIFNNTPALDMETGSWVNFELMDGFGKMLDTTTNTELIEYKKILTDSSNMVLIRSSSITDISFYITPDKISGELLKVLAQKPVASINNSKFKAKLYLINNNSLKVVMNGNFQVMGQFMQAKME